MLSADTLTLVHTDDSKTHFFGVRYRLVRDGVVVVTEEGEQTFTDVIETTGFQKATEQAKAA